MTLKQSWDSLPRKRGNACWEAHPTHADVWRQIISLPGVPSPSPARRPHPYLCTPPPEPGLPVTLLPREKGRGSNSVLSLVPDIFCHLSGEQAGPLITAKGERVFKTQPVKICRAEGGKGSRWQLSKQKHAFQSPDSLVWGALRRIRPQPGFLNGPRRPEAGQAPPPQGTWRKGVSGKKSGAQPLSHGESQTVKAERSAGLRFGLVSFPLPPPPLHRPLSIWRTGSCPLP